MKKAVVIMTKTTDRVQEISSLLDMLDDEQYKAIISLVKVMTTPDTEEQKAIREEERQERERRLQEVKDILQSNVTAYEQWKEKHLHNFSLPSERYDITTSDSDVLIPYMSYLGLNTTEVWDGICNVYLYGFKRGMAYQKKH